MTKKKTAAIKPEPATAPTPSKKPTRSELREARRSVLIRKPKLKCLRHREAAAKEAE